MARVGIDYQDVETAALNLQGQGRVPTVDSIREVLGTGSKTTIAQHLKAWKGRQTDGQGKLPAPLLALVGGLWEQLQQEANRRITDHEAMTAKEIATLQQVLKQTEEAHQTLTDKFLQLDKAYQTEQIRSQALQEKYQAGVQAQALGEARYEASQIQLSKEQAENERLHQLTLHMQASLEHYQASMQARQREESLQFDQERARYQRELSELKALLVASQQEEKMLRQEQGQQGAALERLEKTHDAVLKEYSDVKKSLGNAEQDLAVLYERLQSQQLLVKSLQDKSVIQEGRVLQLEKELAVQAHQLHGAEQALVDSETKLNALQKEHALLMRKKTKNED